MTSRTETIAWITGLNCIAIMLSCASIVLFAIYYSSLRNVSNVCSDAATHVILNRQDAMVAAQMAGGGLAD